jgi:hypothetical protein
LKKNARTNDDFGVFICKMEKSQNYSSGILYVKNRKKMLKLIVVLAFLCNINHKKKTFWHFLYMNFKKKMPFLTTFRSGQVSNPI